MTPPIGITLTRGLPASGKSSWAEQNIMQFPEELIRVERDLLRDQLFGNRLNLTSEQENLVTQMQFAMAKAAISAGKSVIVSDMNLRAQYVRQWAKFAAQNGADFHTVIFDDVSLDDLIQRDMDREHSVGSDVIRSLWTRFTKNGKIAPVDVSKELSDTLKVEPYDNPRDLPEAVIIDIDGTVAKMGNRSPYEWHRVGEDSPVDAVIDAVNSAKQSGKILIFMSGRDEVCREITNNWLTEFVPASYGSYLFMRAEGDTRKDSIVKYELFNKHVRDRFHIKYVLDDRPSVCRMWRKLGLDVFQVGDPYNEF